MFADAGLVANPVEAWGKQSEPLKRDLYMRILRTPHNVVPEHQPEHVSNWGRYMITPNGGIVSLGDTTEDALAMLDNAGSRGAAALGAAAGFIFSSNRLTGAIFGGLLGYFGGKYIVNFAQKAIAAQHAISAVVAPIVPTAVVAAKAG
jgi:hypothetical protein